MQAMIDHTAAVVVGAAILLVLLALSTRSQDSSIEALQVDMAKAELRQLIDVVEQDFINMGSGMANPNQSASDRVVRAFRDSSDYHVLRFRGLQDDTGTPDPALVTYRWRQHGTATLADGSTVNTFEVERIAPGGATMRFDKATAFSVTLRNSYLLPVPPESIADSLARVRYLDVEVGMVSPVGADALLEQTRWSKRFRPINLDAGTRRLVADLP